MKIRYPLVVAWFCFVVVSMQLPKPASAQAAPVASAKLPLNAVLVLAPDFCETKFSQGSMWTTGKETFAVGKEACADLEPVLRPVFSRLTVATAEPAPENNQIVLIPKFVNGHATTAAFAFSDREMNVFLEWSVKDGSGKMLWLQTVTGSAKHHMGNVFTHGHNVKLIAADSVRDAAAQSAARMTAAPELLKFADETAKAAK